MENIKSKIKKKKIYELKESIFSLLGHGVQFDVDTIMTHMISDKPILAKDKVEALKLKLDNLHILLTELENETKIRIS